MPSSSWLRAARQCAPSVSDSTLRELAPSTRQLANPALFDIRHQPMANLMRSTPVSVSSTSRRWLASIVRFRLQDLVGLAVDSVELVIRQVAVLALLAREPLGADRMALVGDGVVPALLPCVGGARLLGKTEFLGRELGSLLRVQLCDDLPPCECDARLGRVGSVERTPALAMRSAMAEDETSRRRPILTLGSLPAPSSRYRVDRAMPSASAASSTLIKRSLVRRLG